MCDFVPIIAFTPNILRKYNYTIECPAAYLAIHQDRIKSIAALFQGIRCAIPLRLWVWRILT